MSDSLPPLLRGLGTLLILLTSALVVTVERRDNTERVEQAHIARIALKAEESLPQGRADTSTLAKEVKLLRLQLQDNDLADDVFENPWFQWLGLLGTGLIAASFFAEWRLKRAIARAARATSPEDAF
ncbi:hypothetical protein [Pseudoxanthomonas sp. Root630]|uniref:hypothetical protein n=1 Tax=Pseudoxanthomonas sp. Root630 TaxID=1736574 RepID=UPI00070271D6|nr:hypothetical protein [Pseudoxanthomonas sp. Root630]KRA44497.1 hypothetical protein ASD72_10930 [Pseudoxanthomonas sp. Root630]|eukprot:Unigene19239_Nuclearia_a/m.54488 Unigene19239_Nuclearia_a/g.54488  ORF Unigene19239_Nuclearia_a/g.54488 Unigene19239_Nuclearia_a/m.54488 type:complete len:127 (+) Unigene19239_Nuclearia_a:103-483(+)